MSRPDARFDACCEPDSAQAEPRRLISGATLLLSAFAAGVMASGPLQQYVSNLDNSAGQPAPDNDSQVSEQYQRGTYQEIDPAIAAAATVQIETSCDFDKADDDPEPVAISEGTGGIYNVDRKIMLGTVAHVAVVTYGLPSERPCLFEVTINPAQGRTISFRLPDDAFEPSYGRRAKLAATRDQPAFAALPEAAAQKVESAIAANQIKPLVMSDSTPPDGQFIARLAGSAGPDQLDSKFSVGRVSLAFESDNQIEFRAKANSNVCDGNSGSALLVPIDGVASNRAIAVISLTVGPANELCATEGVAHRFYE